MSGLTADDVVQAARAMEGRANRSHRWCRPFRSISGDCTELPREGSGGGAQAPSHPCHRFEVAHFEAEWAARRGLAERRRTHHRPPADTLVFPSDRGMALHHVRTLAHDLGIALGGGAHLAALRRTRVKLLGRRRLRVGRVTGAERAAAVVHLNDLHGVPRCCQVRHGQVLERDLGAGPDEPGWAVRTGPMIVVTLRCWRHIRQHGADAEGVVLVGSLRSTRSPLVSWTGTAALKQPFVIDTPVRCRHERPERLGCTPREALLRHGVLRHPPAAPRDPVVPRLPNRAGCCGAAVGIASGAQPSGQGRRRAARSS
ncbi:MAG: hypothetical protein IPI82_15650 [Candidatus Microthrix sp.]|nr:hypothetical protein [Candidatus Microthrix sp.]